MNPNNTQLYRKEGQSQVVDALGNLQSFGGNLDTLPIYKPNNVITTDALAPKTKIDLSGIYPTQPTGDGLVTGVADSTKAFDTEAAYKKELELQKLTKPDSTELDSYLKGLIGAEQGLTGRGAAQSEAEIAAGIPEAQKARSSIQGRLKVMLAEYDAMKKERDQLISDLEVGTRGKGTADVRASVLFGQQGAVERQYLARLNSKASEIGILQAQDEALKGDIETAQNTVNRAIDLKYQDREAEYTAWKNGYDRVKGTFDAEEKKRGEALAAAKAKEEKALADKKEEEKKSNEYLFTAIQGKAPQSLIAKAQDLINKGAKPNEVAKVLGQYSMSLADRLDIQYKQKQIDKLDKELTTKNTDVGELVKINGKDYIRYKDGTISDPVLPEAADTGVVVSRLDNKLKTLSKLTKPSVALATSAGSLRGAPIPFAFKNQINDWRADAVNIIQKLTVDELGRVKSDGVTFGQLSNGERQAVGDAATALGAASIRDKEGNPTGRFRMSEKKVIEEFKKIYDGYALDFERRVGVPYQSYLQNPDAVKEKVVDDFIDQAGTSLINTNIYGGYSTQ